MVVGVVAGGRATVAAATTTVTLQQRDGPVIHAKKLSASDHNAASQPPSAAHAVSAGPHTDEPTDGRNDSETESARRTAFGSQTTIGCVGMDASTELGAPEVTAGLGSGS
jgi:hypothetical protein